MVLEINQNTKILTTVMQQSLQQNKSAQEVPTLPENESIPMKNLQEFVSTEKKLSSNNVLQEQMVSSAVSYFVIQVYIIFAIYFWNREG